MANTTAKRTIHRLPHVKPDLDSMLDAFGLDSLDAVNAVVRDCSDHLGVPTLAVSFAVAKEESPWCDDFLNLTGDADLTQSEERTGALLVLAVDSVVYAIGFGQGYRLLPHRLKDMRFGLSFAIRTINPQQVRDFTANMLGHARTDSSLIPSGASVPALGLRDHGRVVRQLGGFLDDVDLTAWSDSRSGAMTADGGIGLRIKLGTTPATLIKDIRAIAALCEHVAPHPDLAFVEHITPVKDPALIDALDTELDATLGSPADGRIITAVPFSQHTDLPSTTAVTIKVGACAPHLMDEYSLEYVLERARVIKPGERVKALRQGTVALYRDTLTARTPLAPRTASLEALSTESAIKWIEANLSLGSRKFCLHEGEWYEFGAEYLRTIHETLAPLFTDPASVAMPWWPLVEKVNKKGETVIRPVDEGDYNEAAAKARPGWICLDKKNVRNPLRTSTSVEICDLLTEDNTLILVKSAHSSAPLSHLYNQALVATELLRENAAVRADHVRTVRSRRGEEHSISEDFTPRRVVFAILLKDGAKLTPESLFPFSAITLAQTAQALMARGVSVEVVGIEAAPAAAVGTTGFETAA
ncbi:TIGR04141 family sporadically distributed protein [Streptomyces sp. TRM66268-LWL]|uniref:TIGR04141 family sporadically distributed protein n=1 Tax=Streptomyces polyasparticus TaxID=2767826 RepID=A0ABR7SSW9_9ACTN|nr:DUF6119 family protein [Streptomyces polyasparticus]MBC9717989.1 TIGR04141 family sporadically distributed protein [Streptomyces polyasparticus]